MKHPREIDGALVDAYLARRALDYLVGFTLSPVLWRKLPGARSAGRVQSVALRLVCDRELEIEKFIAARILVAGRQHWRRRAATTFDARLVGADGKKIQRLDIGTGARGRTPSSGRWKTAAVHGRLGRGEAGAAQSAATLHHLDDAAGSQPQARLRAGAHHARRAAALRRRRHRRRDRRSHYLYAYRRRRSWRRRPSPASARRSRRELRQGIRAGRAAHLSEQIRRMRRKRTKPYARPIPAERRPKSRNTSTAIRRASTN